MSEVLINNKSAIINSDVFEYKNLKIAYQYKKNDSKSPTILLFYGFGGSTKMMGFLTDYLYKEHSVLIVDYPGHSKSPVNYSYKLENFLEITRILLSNLDINEIYLLGYSFGGIMALHFYEKYNEMVKKIIFLHSIPDFSFNLFYKLLYKLVKILLRINTLFIITRILIPILKDKYFTKEHYSLSVSISKENDSKSVVNLYNDIVYRNFNELVKLINIPTLIIGSKKDILVTEKESINLAKNIKNSKLEILHEHGHLSVITGSDKISKIIIDFLNK